jgi:hypothetical protein
LEIYIELKVDAACNTLEWWTSIVQGTQHCRTSEYDFAKIP